MGSDDEPVSELEWAMFRETFGKIWRAVARLGWLVHEKDDQGAADFLNAEAERDRMMPVRMATAMVSSISKHVGVPETRLRMPPQYEEFLRLCEAEDFNGVLDWWADADPGALSHLLYVLAGGIVQIYIAEGGIMRPCFDANCPVHGKQASDADLN